MSQSTVVTMATLTLSPLLPKDLPLAWSWLWEVPEANFDDYSPANLPAFERELAERRIRGEIVLGVESGGELAGVISYLPTTERSGFLHLCFPRKTHGTGLAYRAVCSFLAGQFASGVEKICGAYHADNARVRRFLKKLGAVDEGYLRAATLRHGVPIDQWLIAIHRDEWLMRKGGL